MTRAFLLSVLSSLVTATGISTAAAGSLASPWDQRPEIHVGVRREPACPPPPSLSADLKASDYYSDPAHSIIDPTRKHAYDEAVRPLQSAVGKLVAMADRYRTSGEEKVASCAAAWLASFSQAGTLTGAMSSNQASYVQGWMLGALSVTWLKIRSDATIPEHAREAIPIWLSQIADRNRQYYSGRDKTKDGRNNHRYWAGFSMMAAGISADRQDLFDWGIESFRIGMNQIQPDGTLPLEMDRRSRALHYHLFAAAPLVMIAELAAANGTDLYREKDSALPRLAKAAISGIENPQSFAAKAGIAQEGIELNAGDIAWAIPFEGRFPDASLHALLEKLKSNSVLYLGGQPPG